MKLPSHVPLVIASRGDTVESVYYGSIAVVAASGELLASVGDVEFPMFTRSTLKPFQALPFLADGGPTHFGFSPQQVALLCASHSGEPRHIAAVSDMLARSGGSAVQLQCGCHVPLWYAATGVAPPPDLQASPLQHNCSGKHAGFLAWCRQHDQPVENYLESGHPLQRAIRQTLAAFIGCDADDMPMGIDGCGAPNYALSLTALARAYARLAKPTETLLHAADLHLLVSAMTQHPEMVSGEARDDLMLMQAGPQDWVAKGGAEGVQAIGIGSRGIGIAMKIADGNPRALRTAVASVIEQLQLQLPGNDRPLHEWREGKILNLAGRQTGRLKPVFEL
jgi:L-asparaginase II